MFEFLVEWASNIIQNYGLLGQFVVMVIGSSPIPIPVEVFALTAVTLGAPPLPTAIFATIGATIGGLISYYIGKGVVGVTRLKRKHEVKIEKMRLWLDNYGTFAVFLFALVPLPYDPMAITVGGVGMKKRNFITATFIGRLMRYIFIVVGGSEALKYFYPRLFVS